MGATPAGTAGRRRGRVTRAALAVVVVTALAVGTMSTVAAGRAAAAPVATHSSVGGYWLVGRDGGVFSFGSARFYGSTGDLTLQRPVVGLAPTANHRGYWLVASDGGIFAFGDAGFYGSIPGLGIAPAGSKGPGPKLNAAVVGIVPTTNGRGYFLVASDGGVFAFGDARFEGSCPGVGGCDGVVKSVIPDATGNGYWVVTTSGHVHVFGNAGYYGEPGQKKGIPVTSAERTPSGRGYWILFANGVVFHYGDAVSYGSLPAHGAGGYDVATAIFATTSGDGYWIATADGNVYSFGFAPDKGSMAGHHLNGHIIDAAGW